MDYKRKRSLKGAGKTWESYNLTYCHPGSMMAYPSNYLETHCEAHGELNPSKLLTAELNVHEQKRTLVLKPFWSTSWSGKTAFHSQRATFGRVQLKPVKFQKIKSSQFTFIRVPASAGATCGLLRLLRCRSQTVLPGLKVLLARCIHNAEEPK